MNPLSTKSSPEALLILAEAASNARSNTIQKIVAKTNKLSTKEIIKREMQEQLKIEEQYKVTVRSLIDLPTPKRKRGRPRKQHKSNRLKEIVSTANKSINPNLDSREIQWIYKQ